MSGPVCRVGLPAALWCCSRGPGQLGVDERGPIAALSSPHPRPPSFRLLTTPGVYRVHRLYLGLRALVLSSAQPRLSADLRPALDVQHTSASIWTGLRVQPILSDEVQTFKALITVHKILQDRKSVV